MYRLNISYKQFYITLNEIWLYESAPNAPRTRSEPGGKQWQHSIRGWRNYPYKGPVIRVPMTSLWLLLTPNDVEHSPRKIRTLWCFVDVRQRSICLYHSGGLLQWHWGNLSIYTMPVKQSWGIWVERSHGSIGNPLYDNDNKTKQNTCIYYGVYIWLHIWYPHCLFAAVCPSFIRTDLLENEQYYEDYNLEIHFSDYYQHFSHTNCTETCTVGSYWRHVHRAWRIQAKKPLLSDYLCQYWPSATA